MLSGASSRVEEEEAVGGVLQVQKKEQGGDLREERRPNTVLYDHCVALYHN